MVLECPCSFCADVVIKGSNEMLQMIFDWLYYECKFDETKTYTWSELMEIYIILREMNMGKPYEEAVEIAKEKRENGFK